MSGSFTDFHGRNGVLRKFEQPILDDILSAKVSQDGAFCAVVTENGLLSFSTLTKEPIKLHLVGSITRYSWARHERSVDYDLSLRGTENYIIVVDLECNICIYSVTSSGKVEHDNCFNLVSFISNEILTTGADAAGNAGSIKITAIIDAAFDDILHNFAIIILIDDRRLLRVLTAQKKEPSIDLDIKLNQYSDIFACEKCCFVCSKIKGSLLLLIDELAVLYIVCLDSKAVLQQCNLLGKSNSNSKLNEDDLCEANCSDFQICGISSNLRYLLIYSYDSGMLYQIQLNVEEIEFLSHSIEARQELDDDKFVDENVDDATTMYGISVQNEVWKSEINAFHREISRTELLCNQETDLYTAAYASLKTMTNNHYIENERGWIIERREKVALPEWTDGYTVKEMIVDTDTALIRMAYSEGDAPLDGGNDENFDLIVVQYDMNTRKFVAQSLPDKAVIAAAESRFFPSCILSQELMYVPTFDATQEQLISNIIQYTGIAEAEAICKSSQWSQFSIPLHSLEVGLQHRQIDTISFFLRTRDKAFSRYWKHLSSGSTASESSTGAANKEGVTGSPSLKCMLAKSSIESPSVDPSELYKAVQMLVRGIHYDSKGRHKKNFFETLLRFTIDFLNSLIMDGVSVLESLDRTEISHHKEPTASFTFLADIPESLNYLVDCIVGVRQYVSDIPDTYSIEEEADTVERGETKSVHVAESQKEYMEAEIYAGRLPHLQKYLLEDGAQDDLDCSLEALTEFGLDFAFRKLKERNIEDAVLIMKNLGADERGLLKQLFDVTLDRGLRNYLLSEFSKDPYRDLLSEDDLKDVQHLQAVEEAYPCCCYSKDNIRDHWEELKPNLHDFDDILVDDAATRSLKSLRKQDEKSVKIKGLYSELTFKWVKEWDESSRKMVLLDAAFQTNQLDHIDEITDAATLWEYLIRHNDIDNILEWIRRSRVRNFRSSNIRIRFPPFDSSLIHKCGHATRQVQKEIYREFLSLGIYTDDMKEDFISILKIVSEDCSLFKASDEMYTVPPIFINQFVEHCLKYNLREVLYIYLDNHEIYPSEYQLGFEQLQAENYPWFKMMNAFRNYQKDKSGIRDISLATSENILKVSGEELRSQLCRNQPLTVLATVLASSLELSKAFSDGSPESTWIDESMLRESLKKYPTLHAAIFNDSKTKKEVTTIQLLQDNTQLDAVTFFQWRTSGDAQVSVPNFSSKELIENYGLRINMTYTYYLKQKRPVYAYLIFVRDVMKMPADKEFCTKMAFLEAYEMAIEHFDEIPVVAGCVLFVDLLGLDSYSMRVDIESANFILRDLDRSESTSFDTEEKLKNFIVVSLKQEEEGRKLMLKLLEECVETGLKKNNIYWGSFEAILFYRIAVQFAQVSNIVPPTRPIEEAIKDGCWFHAIVFMQIYQLKPSEILPSLEKSMDNAVLRDHLYAIIKNAREMMKVPDYPPEQEQNPKRDKKVKQGVQGTPVAKDFRAQFYFNLKKGPENKPVEGGELVKSSLPPSAIDPAHTKDLDRSRSRSNDSMNDRVQERLGSRIDTIQHLDDILDIVLECEDTECPSEMLLRYASYYSQPFLAVLAACYQEYNPLNCFSSWVISSVEKNRRHKTFENISDLGKSDWNIEEMFCLLSDVIKNEEKSIKIIADGFKIFLPKNNLYSFFKFCDSFAAKEDQAVYMRYIKTFISVLEKTVDTSHENEFVRAFFEAKIPIKLITKFSSNFYKRKLLQIYIDSGLDVFMPQNSTSFKMLRTICNLTKDTSVIPDYLSLASCVQDTVDKETERIYELLIEQRHLEKALELSKVLDLPAWKVTFSQVENELNGMKKSGLWQNPETRFEFWVNANSRLRKCLCSHSFAGSFFEEQGMNAEGLPCEERALLLSFAFSWNAEIPFSEDVAGTEQNSKLDDLEKRAWRLKINAEIQRKESVGKESSDPLISAKLFKSYEEKMSELLSKRARPKSDVTYQDGESNLLILDDDDDAVFENEEELCWSEKEHEAFEVMIGELLEKGEIAQARRLSILFGRKTHDLELILTCISLAQGLAQVETLDEPLKGLLARTPARSLSLSGSYEQSPSFKRSVSSVGSIKSTGKLMSEWVLVEELQSAIEKFLSKCRKGRKCCEKILLCFRISKMLSMSYADVVSMAPFEVLEQLIFSGVDQPPTLSRQFLKVFSIKDYEVAAFIKKIVLRLIKSKANIDMLSLSAQEFADSTKLNPNDVPQLMQLVQKPSILGALLLEEAKSIAANQKDDDVYDNDGINLMEVHVELLIRAHDCFTLSCNMEGISDVLRAARLWNVKLIQSKSYSLMVRMLTGIGRFKEMSYIFEALADEHHFELLFRKDIEKEAQLKNALLDYIKKHHPNDTDKIDMLSMRFGMHREVGEQFEETGEKQIRACSSRFSAMSKEMEADLKSIAKTFSYAAANYKKAAFLQKSTRCLKIARLAELQIRLLSQGKQIIGLEKYSLSKILCTHQDFYEALIIADAYNLISPLSWVDPLFERVIMKGEMIYLRQYLSVFQLTGQVLMEIVSRYRSERSTNSMKEHLKELLIHIKDVKLRYKIAAEFNMNDIINNLLDHPNGAYVKDSLFSF